VGGRLSIKGDQNIIAALCCNFDCKRDFGFMRNGAPFADRLAPRTAKNHQWRGDYSALDLFRIEPERLELPDPFRRRIAVPLNADAAGQATSTVALTRLGARKAIEIPMLTCRRLQFSRVQSSVTLVTPCAWHQASSASKF
jgi:hypothetical protein